jgi:hypothetical protein
MRHARNPPAGSSDIFFSKKSRRSAGNKFSRDAFPTLHVDGQDRPDKAPLCLRHVVIYTAHMHCNSRRAFLFLVRSRALTGAEAQRALVATFGVLTQHRRSPVFSALLPHAAQQRLFASSNDEGVIIIFVFLNLNTWKYMHDHGWIFASGLFQGMQVSRVLGSRRAPRAIR